MKSHCLILVLLKMKTPVELAFTNSAPISNSRLIMMDTRGAGLLVYIDIQCCWLDNQLHVYVGRTNGVLVPNNHYAVVF